MVIVMMLHCSTLTHSPTCRACLLWSAPYDGVNPSPLQYRSDTPGNEEDEGDELVGQLQSDSVTSFTVTPPPPVLSPTPSSSDTVSTSTQTGRTSSALELEWDDIFADDDPSLSKASAESMEVDRFTPSPAPLPPRHIQEMRRTATRLVHGSYVEEAEFQDDVLVYDLVAQKDTKSAILERIMAVTRQARGGVPNHRPGKTVLEAVSSIMSTRRRSEDGPQDGRRCSEEQGRRQSEECGKEVWRIQEEGEEELTDTQGEIRGQPCLTNGFDCEGHIAEEDQGAADGEGGGEGRDLTPNQQPQQQQAENAEVLVNGHSDSVTPDRSPPRLSHDFLSCYVELMRSLGVEPEYDDITDDIGTFRRRVRMLRRKLEAEEGLTEEFVIKANRNNHDEGREEEEGTEEEDEGEEEDEEGEEEQKTVSSKSDTRRGASFTGIGFKVIIITFIFFFN